MRRARPSSPLRRVTQRINTSAVVGSSSSTTTGTFSTSPTSSTDTFPVPVRSLAPIDTSSPLHSNNTAATTLSSLTSTPSSTAFSSPPTSPRASTSSSSSSIVFSARFSDGPENSRINNTFNQSQTTSTATSRTSRSTLFSSSSTQSYRAGSLSPRGRRPTSDLPSSSSATAAAAASSSRKSPTKHPRKKNSLLSSSKSFSPQPLLTHQQQKQQQQKQRSQHRRSLSSDSRRSDKLASILGVSASEAAVLIGSTSVPSASPSVSTTAAATGFSATASTSTSFSSSDSTESRSRKHSNSTDLADASSSSSAGDMRSEADHLLHSVEHALAVNRRLSMEILQKDRAIEELKSRNTYLETQVLIAPDAAQQEEILKHLRKKSARKGNVKKFDLINRLEVENKRLRAALAERGVALDQLTAQLSAVQRPVQSLVDDLVALRTEVSMKQDHILRLQSQLEYSPVHRLARELREKDERLQEQCRLNGTLQSEVKELRAELYKQKKLMRLSVGDLAQLAQLTHSHAVSHSGDQLDPALDSLDSAHSASEGHDPHTTSTSSGSTIGRDNDPAVSGTVNAAVLAGMLHTREPVDSFERLQRLQREKTFRSAVNTRLSLLKQESLSKRLSQKRNKRTFSLPPRQPSATAVSLASARRASGYFDQARSPAIGISFSATHVGSRRPLSTMLSSPISSTPCSDFSTSTSIDRTAFSYSTATASATTASRAQLLSDSHGRMVLFPSVRPRSRSDGYLSSWEYNQSADDEDDAALEASLSLSLIPFSFDLPLPISLASASSSSSSLHHSATGRSSRSRRGTTRSSNNNGSNGSGSVTPSSSHHSHHHHRQHARGRSPSTSPRNAAADTDLFFSPSPSASSPGHAGSEDRLKKGIVFSFADGDVEVSSARVDSLLDWLLRRNTDVHFLRTILLTYRQFCTGQHLLGVIIEQFARLESAQSIASSSEDPDVFMQLTRAADTLSVWVESYPADFHEDSALCAQLESFLSRYMGLNSRFESTGSRLLAVLHPRPQPTITSFASYSAAAFSSSSVSTSGTSLSTTPTTTTSTSSSSASTTASSSSASTVGSSSFSTTPPSSESGTGTRFRRSGSTGSRSLSPTKRASVLLSGGSSSGSNSSGSGNSAAESGSSSMILSPRRKFAYRKSKRDLRPVGLSKIEFQQLSPSHVAEQLVIREANMLIAISGRDLLQYANQEAETQQRAHLERHTHTHHKVIRAHNQHSKVGKVLAWFNTVSRWCATELVTTPNPKHRVAVLKRLILMAKHCFKLRAYNTLLELLAGLNLASVQRLKSTWEAIPHKFMRTFTQLDQVMSGASNYHHYRETLDRSPAPVLPYVGLIVKDLTQVSELSPAYNDLDYLNVERLRQQSDIVFDFEELVRDASSYSIALDTRVQWYLDELVVCSRDDLRKHSLLCEPQTRQIW